MTELHQIQAIYIVVFGLTAAVCFAVIPRALTRIEDNDTRIGLTALLALSGLWATFYVGRLAVPSTPLKITFYILGLTVGLATVGAWLYFCSAYAGESYHRERRFRTLAVAVYLAIVAIKITSPLHGLYFSAGVAATPFPHLEISLKPLHWGVTGLAYVLSGIGFYILFDMFRDSNYVTTRLGALVGLAALPVLFNFVGYVTPDAILTLNHEPIGVALFAIGVLYVADGSFLAVRRFGREQLFDEIDQGVVVLDTDGTIRDVNAQAEQAFPELAGSAGKRLAEAAPRLNARLPPDDAAVVTFDETDPPQYYLFTSRQLTAGQTTIGRTLLFTEITEIEQQRRAVAHHQQQFDAFAEAITHELRNTLGIVQGHLQLATTQLDSGADSAVGETLETVTGTTDRMASIVADLATLAQYGEPVETTSRIQVAPIAQRAWESLSPTETELIIGEGGRIDAHDVRLERLFQNLFEFAIDNGATRVELTQQDGQLIMTDDGAPISESAVEAAFEYGQPVPSAKSGMLLPGVRTLAEAHGWVVTIDTDYEGGVRIVIEL